MFPSLLIILALQPGLAPQDTKLSLVHRIDGKDVARSELSLLKDRVTGTVEGTERRVTAEIVLGQDGRVSRYVRTLHGKSPDRLVGKVTLTSLGHGSGYRLREAGPLGSRSSRIKSGRVHAVLDSNWLEALIPAFTDIDAGRIDVLDLAAGKVRTVRILARQDGARYLDLPGGGPTLRLSKERAFVALELPGVGGARIVRAGADEAKVAPPAGVVEEELTLPDPSARPATISRPRESGEARAGVVLLGDGNATDRDGNAAGGRSHLMRALAWDLAEAGWVVIRFDPRDPRSPGTSLEVLKADVLAAAQALSRRTDVDAARVSLVGHGQGALIAVEAARGTKDLINRVVGLAPPARPLREAMRTRLRARLRALGGTTESIRAAEEALERDLDQLRDLEKGEELPPGGALLRELLHLRPNERYLASEAPLLLVFAENDVEIPASHRAMVQTVMSLRGNGRITVRVISSADRLFRETGMDGPSAGGAADVARRRHPALLEYVRIFLEAGNR